MIQIAKTGTPRRKSADMFPLIEKYLRSNLTQHVFCQQENLNYKTFHYWLKKYREHKKTHQLKTNGKDVTFLPVHITQPSAENAACTISYPSGITIRFSQPVEVNVLRQLIADDHP